MQGVGDMASDVAGLAGGAGDEDERRVGHCGTWSWRLDGLLVLVLFWCFCCWAGCAGGWSLSSGLGREFADPHPL
eukprot:3027426-Rhodomonas_salina.1